MLGAQEDVEKWQADEMERKNKIRRVVRTLTCPTCKARADEPCKSPKGTYRVHNHRERMAVAIEKGLITKSNTPGRNYPVYIYTITEESI